MSEGTLDSAAIRDAASVILVRERAGTSQVEVFMLRRHRKSSFMGSAFVFPGGASDPGETDLRLTAARELFEEAGVLIADRPVAPDQLDSWRTRLHDTDEAYTEILQSGGVTTAVERLHYFSHWITPSVERKRFSARFYLAVLPEGQSPSFDDRETVEEAWVTPDEALLRAKEMRLPPPQVRTLSDLRGPCAEGIAAVLADAEWRSQHRHPLLPRMCPRPSGFALLLPWDTDYETKGTGDSLPMPSDHPLAVGPSRFILEESTWKNVCAPDSPDAG